MPPELIRAVLFTIPLVSAVVCLMVTAFDLRRTTSESRRRIHLQALSAYGVFALCWGMFVLHSLSHAVWVWLVPLFVPSSILSCVLLYRMIRTMTDAGMGSSLPRGHYVLPVVMAVVLGFLWLVLPFGLIDGVLSGEPVRGVVVYVIACVCLTCNVLYPTMSLRRIVRFRRPRLPLNGTAPKNEIRPKAQPTKGITGLEFSHRRTLDRFFWAILIDTLVVPVPLFAMLLDVSPFSGEGLWWLLSVLPSRVIYVLSCFNLIADNYLAVDPLPEVVGRPAEPAGQSEPASQWGLSRKRVDSYIETRKPWLDPAFRLNDMAGELYSNRAYVSAFINSEYGMNFNRFINTFRLEEVERLRAEAVRRGQRVSMLQLILNAGFGNYRSYLRAKDAADAQIETKIEPEGCPAG